MRRSSLIIFLLLIFDSCISPYEGHTPFKEQIVVQGMITDQPGPYLVRISKTLPVEAQLEPGAMGGGKVLIQDDQGNSENLLEFSPGNYYTNTFQGLIGRTYWITVTTQEGVIYRSLPEKLLPVGDFTNLRYEFELKEDPASNQQVSSTNGFNIFLDSDVLPEQEMRVWWRWTGTYEILTAPQLRTTRITLRTGQIITLPDPIPCSGYTRSPDGLLAGPFHDCTCCTCWVTEYNESPIISDFRFVTNGKIPHFNVDFIEANRRTFYKKYYLEVEQLSASQAVYDFWKSVQTQRNNGTNLFQTPSPKAVGNMVAVTENAIPVLGYFAASSSKKHTLVIDRADVPYPLLEMDTLIMKCTDALKFSSAVKPPFW